MNPKAERLDLKTLIGVPAWPSALGSTRSTP